MSKNMFSAWMVVCFASLAHIFVTFSCPKMEHKQCQKPPTSFEHIVRHWSYSEPVSSCCQTICKWSHPDAKTGGLFRQLSICLWYAIRASIIFYLFLPATHTISLSERHELARTVRCLFNFHGSHNKTAMRGQCFFSKNNNTDNTSEIITDHYSQQT